LPERDASMSIVSPPLSVRLMSAPASNNIFTIAALPFLHACASDDMP
jgi:hypothetical protein